jgi:cystathionine beta-synthase
MSEMISLEKEQILQALGAKVVRTPVGVPVDSPNHVTNTARRLQKEVPNSHILDQFANPDNPAAHEFGTAEEIWYQSEGKIDAVIAGAGTGGTLTGTARGLRKHKPGIFMVGVDPAGSVLGIPRKSIDEKTEILVEGIGQDFVPDVLDQGAANLWIKANNEHSFRFARQLIREEGLLCGGSSGANVAALAQLVEKHPELNTPDKVIVIVFPDGMRNYLSKFVSNEWMKKNRFPAIAKL